jgi:deoxyribonuclease V
MLIALDVCYGHDRAIAAAVVFEDWSAAQPTTRYISHIDAVAAYEPGAFYKRELPCLLRVLQEHRLRPTHLLIDGYVDLDRTGRPGLGRYLYESLDGASAVIGIAKTAFAGITTECEILRSDSTRPLYITCAGVEITWAKERIRSMHGPYRIPTLLKDVDRLCRTGGV